MAKSKPKKHNKPAIESTKNSMQQADFLIFIDANILLDFYRLRKSDVSMDFLQKIDAHKNLIITSSQVEMEYMKHRQRAILESIGELKKLRNFNVTVPVVLDGTDASESIRKSKLNIESQQQKLKHRIESIFRNPRTHDPVYKGLQGLFENNSGINLTRTHEKRMDIRELARKRFELGYPPRKEKDTSLGDAIHWEWIIHCAITTEKNIIIVTRDSDFGAQYNRENYINDWLSKEFKERVGAKRKLVLTDRLSNAFELVQIDVTEEMKEEEKNVVDSKSGLMNPSNLHQWHMFISESLISPEVIEGLRKMGESVSKMSSSFRQNDSDEEEND